MKIHVRIPKEMSKDLELLVKKGLYSNKNEIIRAAIRSTLLKYKDLKK